MKNRSNKNNSHNFEILVENASSGRQLIQEFEHSMPIVAINPRKSKAERFQSIVFLFENKKCQFPDYSGVNFEFFNFMTEFEDEIFSFPDSKYSDSVDSVSQFLNYQFNTSKDKNQLGPQKIIIS
jgi:phage terminase large subunit-like protein